MEKIRDDYFEWLMDIVCSDLSKQISYRKLLRHLHDTEFRYTIPKDENRACDGVSMRYHYAYARESEEYLDYVLEALDGPCSVLEMMIGLAIRCEDTMDDPAVGDRTGQWFWRMCVNLGLGGMSDMVYDEEAVHNILERFLDRKYEANGRGGLFRVKDPPRDLREVEIWNQLWWSLSDT